MAQLLQQGLEGEGVGAGTLRGRRDLEEGVQLSALKFMGRYQKGGRTLIEWDGSVRGVVTAADSATGKLD